MTSPSAAPATDAAARDALAYRLYPYARSPDQDAGEARRPVVVIGAGPVGLAFALDLGLRGVPVVVLDDHEGVGEGSRAICFSKRTLEIAHRLGCGAPLVEEGVVWNLGKVFHGGRKVYEFNLSPEAGHRFPAFINLAQPDFERALVGRIRAAQAEGAPIDLRGRNRVLHVAPGEADVALDIVTPEGPYRLTADWLVAADGAGSPTRKQLGLEFEGKVFQDNFLIADVRMAGEFPTERWFWFDPPFKDAGASALLHKQPNGVWRIDFQIGWNVDRQAELAEDKVRARLDAMLGPDCAYEIVWTSIYAFQCRRLTRFRHGRVVFIGDAAHQVSPFGARGANSGVQDAENLAWKLALVARGEADDILLDTYDAERLPAADENIAHSTRATDFITPHSPGSRVLRDAVLALAEHHEFARPMVNSGRLSVPAVYDGSPLNGEDALPGGPDRTRPGAPCPDAPLGNAYLLDRLGSGFTLLTIGNPEGGIGAIEGLATLAVEGGASPVLDARYLGDAPSAVYLIRPDHHIVARWARFEPVRVQAACARAQCHGEG